MEEIFDIVNEQDQVVGSAPRSEVHAKGLLHRAAHILLFNQEGKVLLQLRSPHKDRHPNVWDSSASGHIDSGETYSQAASRETKEELGLTQTPKLTELAYVEVAPETDQEFIKVYTGKCEGPFKPLPSEVSKVCWFLLDEVDALITQENTCAPAFAYIWKKYRTAFEKIVF